jgi:glycosyltransferase involved in cell wall biosynthesis
LQRDLPIGTTMKSFFRDLPAREARRKEWGAGPVDSVLLYTGKHDEDKSPHLFYEAVSSLGAMFPGQLMVVSVGAQDSAYFEKVCQPVLRQLKERGVKVLISPAIPSPQLREYYSAADIGVFPSRNTLSCLDAMACGLPTVMQDDATNRDRLQAGGLVYEAGNLDGLTARIRELLEDPQQRLSLGRAGIADMRQRYDYGTIVARLESELAAAVEKHESDAGAGGQ